MAYINELPDLPGITAGFAYAPEVGAAMSQLAEALLRGPSTLDPGFRELIAALVSKQNCTQFCTGSHAAVAGEYLTHEFVAKILSGMPHPDDMREALLTLASSVALKIDTKRAIEEAIRFGATDREVHDTVAIAAAFCMYNRYVDGLGMHEADDYQPIGVMLRENGYMKNPEPEQPKPFVPKERKAKARKSTDEPKEAENG